MKKQQPIGLFDSGVGGLTIAKELLAQLPQENLIYFGDTAHFPYGDKSEQAIINYSSKIVDFLLARNVKLIVIACNSASSVAYTYLQSVLPKDIHLINVIDPIVDAICQPQLPNEAQPKIGLIGTRRTVQSQSYQQRFQAKGYPLQVHATPILAAAVEEGFAGTAVMQSLIAHYLQAPCLNDIDHLILGCTHYPLIKTEIQQFYQNQTDKPVAITDSAAVVVEHIKARLQTHDLLNDTGNGGLSHCYLSDVTDSFCEAAVHCFAHPVEIEHFPLWD